MERCSFKEGCTAPLAFPGPRIGRSGWWMRLSSNSLSLLTGTGSGDGGSSRSWTAKVGEMSGIYG
jgi:hypothetical protein